jgi:hypothetical protein
MGVFSGSGRSPSALFQMLNAAPVGSMSVAPRPKGPKSAGADTALAPAANAAAYVASTSLTER